jgi:hypothetical protein
LGYPVLKSLIIPCLPFYPGFILFSDVDKLCFTGLPGREAFGRVFLSLPTVAIGISAASIDLIEGAVDHILGAEQKSLQFPPLPVKVVYFFAQPADILHISPFFL